MFAVFLQGFALSAAMILPLGPQNVFVMNQGIRRQNHLLVASLCALSDIALICAGIFGGSALLHRSSLLLMLVTWGGVAFLLWYGWGAFRAAFNRDVAEVSVSELAQSRWRIIVSMLAVTWLNPHVYLDTFVVLGSLGSQFAPEVRSWFAFGAVSASVVWFYVLALLAAWLSPYLKAPLAQRIINILVGLVMWAIAVQLAWNGMQ
ncbi:L-lysine exporter [Serratia sp. FGI94]|uniref:arginine exporter ArgO n=1 Tax=Serratia sp. FGI94 TaxID=671990 RepID=UPI0002A6FD91|nr:arginine exporter ArgO [Serratia sp. FGI94]AGB83867.1 L-lysine exporter [Serratia sp. FGI94]